MFAFEFLSSESWCRVWTAGPSRLKTNSCDNCTCKQTTLRLEDGLGCTNTYILKNMHDYLSRLPQLPGCRYRNLVEVSPLQDHLNLNLIECTASENLPYFVRYFLMTVCLGGFLRQKTLQRKRKVLPSLLCFEK